MPERMEVTILWSPRGSLPGASAFEPDTVNSKGIRNLCIQNKKTGEILVQVYHDSKGNVVPKEKVAEMRLSYMLTDLRPSSGYLASFEREWLGTHIRECAYVYPVDIERFSTEQ